MKRGRRELEAQSDQDHRESHGEQWAVGQHRNAHSNLRKVDRTRDSVDQAEAKQEERRRHPAEEEVLQPGFGGLGPPLIEARQHIERQARQFERQKRKQQLLHGRHEGKAGRGKENDGDKFGGIARTTRGACDPEHQQSEDEDAQSSGDREAVEHERSPEYGAPRTRPGQRARAEHRKSTNSQGLCEALRIVQAPSDRKVQAEHRKGPGD